MALLRAPFFYYPTPSPPLPLKQRNFPHFAPHAISRSAACSQKAAPPLYYSISDLRDGIAWWDLYNRIFFQYTEQLELFLVLAAASGLYKAPKRCGSRSGHLKETVVSSASCYKSDGTNSEPRPLPTLPSQLCLTGMLSRVLLPTTPRVALIFSS